MKYFKNTELAKLYHVSEKTVRNWIESAQAGKLDLHLYTEKEKSYVANTAANIHLVEQLVQKGRKYKNSRGSKSVTPTADLYNNFDVEEIFDLISSIDIHREIPHKYCYFAEGARAWDDYVKRMSQQQFPNSLTNTIELMNLNIDYLDAHLQGFSSVNVVDIGVGNAFPVKSLLKHLLQKGVLKRYIAIDASNDMIDIAQQNIEAWFDGKVPFERHIKDANYDRFDELLVSETFNKGEERTLNLVLFLGGTIVNLRDSDLALRTMCNSLGKDDLFILSRKLDTPGARRFFDIGTRSSGSKLLEKEKAIIEMLGINESLYSVEQFFDEQRRRRVIQIRLNVDLSITFKLGDKKRVVHLRKNEAVLVWHANHDDLIEIAQQFDNNGLDIISIAKSKDQQYAQVISKIKTEQ